MSNIRTGQKVEYTSYRAAADRIRRGEELEMDDAICDAYTSACRTCGESPANGGSRDCPTCGIGMSGEIRSIWDLPIARALYEADRRDGAK